MFYEWWSKLSFSAFSAVCYLTVRRTVIMSKTRICTSRVQAKKLFFKIRIDHLDEDRKFETILIICNFFISQTAKYKICVPQQYKKERIESHISSYFVVVYPGYIAHVYGSCTVSCAS